MKGIIENKDTGETAQERDARRKAERLKNQPEKKRKAIPKFSAKRKKENEEYKPLREKYLSYHPECEVKLIGCEGKSVEIHHCSTSHKDFLNTKTWKAVDRHCHDKIEFFESALSRKEKGLLL